MRQKTSPILATHDNHPVHTTLALPPLAALAAALALSGCLGGSSAALPSEPATVAGVLLDSAVEGATYTASPSGKTGATSASGAFNCVAWDSVTFKIGGIELGKANCASTRGLERGRPTRLWLFKFPKALTSYTLP